jgi:hypothetical protein
MVQERIVRLIGEGSAENNVITPEKVILRAAQYFEEMDDSNLNNACETINKDGLPVKTTVISDTKLSKAITNVVFKSKSIPKATIERIIDKNGRPIQTTYGLREQLDNNETLTNNYVGAVYTEQHDNALHPSSFVINDGINKKSGPPTAFETDRLQSIATSLDLKM